MTDFKNGHFLVVVLTASIKWLGFERTFRKKEIPVYTLTYPSLELSKRFSIILAKKDQRVLHQFSSLLCVTNISHIPK